MAVQLFLGGSIMLALGIIGEYLGIVYNETKKLLYLLCQWVFTDAQQE